MFGVGAPEFITVLIIALIVLGPDRLPLAMRQIGRWIRRLREMTREFRAEFAEEFQFLQEELDMIRKEAAATRDELNDIRRELTDTMQETADELTSARDDFVSEIQGAVSSVTGSNGSGGAEEDAHEDGATAGGDDAIAAAVDVEAAEQPAPGPADVMAQAIIDTFSANGEMLEATRKAFAATGGGLSAITGTPASLAATEEPRGTPITSPQPAGLSAFAPDVSGPVEEAPAVKPAGPQPPIYYAPEPAASTAGIVAAGIGAAAEPALHNQMGGFMRLIIMKALEDDPDFRREAEETLRAQAQLDAQRAAEIEDAEILDLAQAWARQRRQLVAHGSVTVEQKAEKSAVIELFECPYRLKRGEAHPVCDVSNLYDEAFFEQFDAKAMYTQRISDGARSCKLIVVANEKLAGAGVVARKKESAAAETVSDPTA